MPDRAMTDEEIIEAACGECGSQDLMYDGCNLECDCGWRKPAVVTVDDLPGPLEPERVILYTSAPAVYDGFSTTELVADAGRDNRGKVLRKVSLEPRDREWQTNRYLSGLHGFATPEEVAKYPQIWKVTG